MQNHDKKHKAVVDSSVQYEVPNHPMTPQTTNRNPYIKVPVVLGETTVQIDLDSIIEFPEPVLEIKRIKKNLKLVQCRLLLPTNKLFLKGFVRKNIQYATPRKGSHDYVSSSIHSLTVDVPFQAVTAIDFINTPEFRRNPDTRQFDYFKASPLPLGYPDKENLLSGDFSQYNQVSGEVFNELPYCELLSSHFIEYDEALNRKMGCVTNKYGYDIEAPFEEGTFTKIEEKMVIELSLKVLQKQQVQVGGGGHDHGHGCDRHEHHHEHYEREIDEQIHEKVEESSSSSSNDGGQGNFFRRGFF